MTTMMKTFALSATVHPTPLRDGESRQYIMGVYKPSGRPAYAYAYEGIMGKAGHFMHEPFNKNFRQYRVELQGNNTAKNRDAAMATLLLNMHRDNALVKDCG